MNGTSAPGTPSTPSTVTAPCTGAITRRAASFSALLAFDPGEEESVCSVDGQPDEWSAADIVHETEELTLSLKYDEKFIYLYAQGEDLDAAATPLYIPLDLTPNSGSTHCEDPALDLSGPAISSSSSTAKTTAACSCRSAMKR